MSTPPIAEALDRGVLLHRGGQLDAAEAIYRQVLKQDPRNARGWHLLGLIAHARGQLPPARECLTRSIQLDGSQAAVHHHLADVFRLERRFAEAEASCRRALQLSDDPIIHNTLGAIASDQGQFERASQSYRHAIELLPTLALAHANLAAALVELNRLPEAIDACRQALALAPNLAAAYDTLGLALSQQGNHQDGIQAYRAAIGLNPQRPETEYRLGALLQLEDRPQEAIACYRSVLAQLPEHAPALCNLATALRDTGDVESAVDLYRAAIARDPQLAEAHYNLGVLFQQRKQLTEAEACYKRAIQAKPDYAQAYNNLGTLLRGPNNLAAARDCFSQALVHRPDFAEALNNLGNVFKLEGRPGDARVCYEQTLRIEPDHVQARYNRAVMLLSEGHYAEGWAEYEWRTRSNQFGITPHHQPRWQGEPLAGRPLLVHAEQGLGDTLHFIRYLPQLAERGAGLICEVQRSLLPLLEVSGLGRYATLVARGEPLPTFELQVPLLSLPGLLEANAENVPLADGYLQAKPELIAHWNNVLGPAERFRVGIVWQGSTTHTTDLFRSVSLSLFEPLAQANVKLISLQKGPGSEQLAALQDRFQVRALSELDEMHGPFMDTAAVIKNLDLVVSCDTAIAHLAGGLGVPVWVALGVEPDWRWQRTGERTPWYSSMRLFRQSTLGDWNPVFAEMARELAPLAAARG